MTTVNAIVRDIMTTPVVTVRPDTAFKAMAAKLREQRISAFPVVADGKKVIGVVPEADLQAKEALAGRPETAELGHALAGLARDVRGVVTVHDCLSYPGMYPAVAGPVL